MDPATVMLIKLLSDVAMTAMKTIGDIDKMTEDEIQTAILAAQQQSKNLIEQVKGH